MDGSHGWTEVTDGRKITVWSCASQHCRVPQKGLPQKPPSRSFGRVCAIWAFRQQIRPFRPPRRLRRRNPARAKKQPPPKANGKFSAIRPEPSITTTSKLAASTDPRQTTTANPRENSFSPTSDSQLQQGHLCVYTRIVYRYGHSKRKIERHKNYI